MENPYLQQARNDLQLRIAESITSDTDYQARIIVELSTYTLRKLRNTACEYTNLTLKQVKQQYL